MKNENSLNIIDTETIAKAFNNTEIFPEKIDSLDTNDITTIDLSSIREFICPKSGKISYPPTVLKHRYIRHITDKYVSLDCYIISKDNQSFLYSKNRYDLDLVVSEIGLILFNTINKNFASEYNIKFEFTKDDIISILKELRSPVREFKETKSIEDIYSTSTNPYSPGPVYQPYNPVPQYAQLDYTFDSYFDSEYLDKLIIKIFKKLKRNAKSDI